MLELQSKTEKKLEPMRVLSGICFFWGGGGGQKLVFLDHPKITPNFFCGQFLTANRSALPIDAVLTV